MDVQKNDDIEVLHLPTRIQNCLRRAGITTVEQLMACSQEKLLRMHNIGHGAAAAVQECCAELHVLEGDSVGSAAENPAHQASAKMFCIKNGEFVYEASIDELDISVRARNCLRRAGVTQVSQLFAKSREQLKEIRHMGEKSAEEVYACIQKIQTVAQLEEAEDAQSCDAFHKLADTLVEAYGKTRKDWMPAILLVHQKYPEATEGELIAALYCVPAVRQAAVCRVRDILSTGRQDLSCEELAVVMPRHLDETDILNEILCEMKGENVGFITKGRIGEEEHSTAMPLQVCMDKMVDRSIQIRKKMEMREHLHKVLSLRLSGKTLEETGQALEITRERVRQLEQKALILLRQIAPNIEENRYRSVFDTYDLTQDIFLQIFLVDASVYRYLQMTTRKKLPPKRPALEMLADEDIPIEIRSRAEQVLHGNDIKLDGQWISQNRKALANYYVAHFCTEEIDFRTFGMRLDGFLRSLPIREQVKAQILDRSTDVDNGLKNYLRDSHQVLWMQNERFRYYDTDAEDFTELLETIDLENCGDVEISTLKFFRDYPELMTRYDIHNEYELHNLLKKLWDGKSDRVCFARMPTIRVGSGSYRRQMLEMLQEEGEMTTEAICKKFEERYGVKRETCIGCYLNQPEIFVLGNLHSVVSKPFPADDKKRMQWLMSDDFYTIQQARELYHYIFPNRDPLQFAPCHMKELGFNVYAGYNGYLIRNRYDSVRGYFITILQQDLIDLEIKNPALRGIAGFKSLMREMKKDYEIVEYEPLKLIHCRYLQVKGLTRRDLYDYVNGVASVVPEGVYFTAHSLGQDGCSCKKIDALKFGDWFYSSIILEDTADFSAKHIGGTYIFVRGRTSANLGDMLMQLIQQAPEQKMQLCALEQLLCGRYGVVLRRNKLIAIIRSTSLFYEDGAVKMIYRNRTDDLGRSHCEL